MFCGKYKEMTYLFERNMQYSRVLNELVPEWELIQTRDLDV
jgi:hypothetical protein